MNKCSNNMKVFYCYVCKDNIEHDVYMAHDLAFCCNTHRDLYLRKSSKYKDHTNKSNMIKNNNENIYETIKKYNKDAYEDKKSRTCSIIYDYLQYIK